MSKLTSVFYGISLSYLSITGASGEPPERESSFKYERISSVSINDLWHTDRQLIVGDGVSIVYFNYDPEQADRRGGWIAQGIILGGSADLASKPIAIKLWSKSAAVLDSNSVKVSTGQRDVLALFKENSSCQPSACKQSQFKFSVMADGRVYADNRLIGHVE